MVPPASLVLPLPVTVPSKLLSTRYSLDHGELVSDATGSIDSLRADTVNTQPSGVVSVPGDADAIGAPGAAGAGGAGTTSATGWTTGSAAGSA